MFGSIKTATVKYFDERYIALSKTVVIVATTIVAAARIVAGRAFLYLDFDNTKPQAFDGV